MLNEELMAAVEGISGYDDLIWSSDWNGDEVGYDEIPVVGLYSLKSNPDIYVYIDSSNLTILEAWDSSDEED